jgi:hypothetical protein
LRGRRLDREQFHLLCSLEALDYSSKTVGLSEYDDFEVYEHFCYEDGERTAYIDPAPAAAMDSECSAGTVGTKVRVGGPVIAPEDIDWQRLRTEQRAFFERYLPDIAKRFKRSASAGPVAR